METKAQHSPLGYPAGLSHSSIIAYRDHGPADRFHR